MSLYTIEIDGRPIMTFAAQDQMEADAFTEADHLQADLMVLEHNKLPLWDGESELFVRKAHPEEEATWEVRLAQSQQKDLDPDPDSFAVFLVEVSDPDDEADEGDAE